MPVYPLDQRLWFPHPSMAESGGLLAYGGDLDPQRLILAYRHGIFPWYSEDKPILWWCPSPRLVLVPSELRVGRTLRKVLARRPYTITLDTCFSRVVAACAGMTRPDQDGTWITTDMQVAFGRLHALGLAHSVEAWQDDELVGGLYGLSLGGVFFGESMFALRPNASKVAFVALVEQLRRWAFDLIDCQVVTEHLVRFGARELPLESFLEDLARSTRRPTRRGPWAFDPGPDDPPA